MVMKFKLTYRTVTCRSTILLFDQLFYTRYKYSTNYKKSCDRTKRAGKSQATWATIIPHLEYFIKNYACVAQKSKHETDS